MGQDGLELKETQEKKSSAAYDVISLTAIRAGEEVFRAHGVAHVKVAKGERVTILKIPIKSTGIWEALEALKTREPRPPVVDQLVDSNHPAGKQIRLAPGQKQWIKMPNLQDETYLRAVEHYQMEVAFEIIAVGLGIDIEDERGQVVTGRDEKIRILREAGLSVEQFNALAEAIRSLTRLDESEQLDFLRVT